ncbi:MAG: hypothetical protein LC102_12270 [Ignavibacteriales bacterium]|nr:MAG: hypothetical protein F9K26_11035 [Ignavibacteriaceae bacterium]MBW7873849.1 hypothetical protein [Ignavibacteria bacterium]MCZ2144186.1 hypothetical protein [Ignavibacteriales bacterium]OQY71273.1 MAG: hypothetical protein B6D45_10260 [Ignavibacteriales bacterium UTCHB3]MBV6445825.1 hypothetical protein [Ignavibacteriaceae bacterium]
MRSFALFFAFLLFQTAFAGDPPRGASYFARGSADARLLIKESPAEPLAIPFLEKYRLVNSTNSRDETRRTSFYAAESETKETTEIKESAATTAINATNLTNAITTTEALPNPGESKARGFFAAFGVGPRVPVGNFSSKTMLGYGFNAEISYVDNKIMPYFLFGRLGFEQFPGSQDYYQLTEITHYSMQYLPMSLGVRHYFPPILKNVFLLTPVAEISAIMVIYQELEDYKAGSHKNSFLEDGVRFGASAGFGISAFVLDMMLNYNIYQDNQFLSLDLKVRLPLYVAF